MSFQTVLDQASHVRSQNQHWAHTLRVAGLLLQHLPSARLHTAGARQFRCVEDLWPHLILPGLGHAVAAVRSILQLCIVHLPKFVHQNCMIDSICQMLYLPCLPVLCNCATMIFYAPAPQAKSLPVVCFDFRSIRPVKPTKSQPGH